MMTWTKCAACDGYGTKPHRSKPGKVVRCKACDRKGVLAAFTIGGAPLPLPDPPSATPRWMDPIVPWEPPLDTVWQPPQITCGGVAPSTAVFRTGGWHQ
jgi:hypothetical protein